MDDPDARDPYRKPGHEYFDMPPGVRVCDDRAGESYVLYRDGEVVCDAEDVERVSELVRRRFDLQPDARLDTAGTGLAVLPLGLTAQTDLQTVEVVRTLQALDEDPGRPLRVGYHHVLTVQSHVKWSPGTPPRPLLQPLGPLPAGKGLPGSGVRVGVVDTGWDEQPWFTRTPETPGDVSEELDEENDRSLDAEAGHGTFVAGVVLQHAPGVTLVVRRLDDEKGCVDDEAAAQVVRELLDTGVDVLSLSFGGYTADNLPHLSPVCRVLSAALDADPDLVVVAAAGNDSWDRAFYPAALKRVVAVGALDAEGQGRASFSNYGSWVDAWTTGEQLDSTFVFWPVGDGEMRLGQPPAPGVRSSDLTLTRPFEGWATWSGTSFAAPRVAAAIAAELGSGSRTPRQVVFDLVHGSNDRVESGARVEPTRYVS